MAFAARFPGTCYKCSNPIERGQLISWNRKRRGQAAHVTCDSPNAQPETQPVTVPVETTEAQTPNPTVNAIHAPRTSDVEASAFAGLAQAIAPYLDGKLAEKLDVKQVQNIVLDMLAEFSTTTIRVENASTGTVREIPNAHANMDKLIYFLSKRHHVYLYGAPGSGKSTAAKQVADALGLAFGYISLNPQSPDSRLMGYMDATGNYRETVFYNLYRNGGVFCIDEMDNAAPSLLTTLNSCLENGHAAFPNGMIERHKDFVVVATGNTAGRGANPMFPERRPFDAAFAERFTYLAWDYDIKMERAVASSINPKAISWIDWVQAVRKYATKSFPRLVVSPRASFKGAEYLLDNTLTVEQIAEAVLFKGIDADTVRSILSANPLPERVQ